MQFSSYCVECLLKRQAQRMYDQKDEKKALEYLKEVMKIMIEAPEGSAPPYLLSEFNKVYGNWFDNEDQYAEIKRTSNDYVLKIVPEIRAIQEKSKDPVLEALKYARAGNYIDFGALSDTINNEELDRLINSAKEENIDEYEYESFQRDLSSAKHLLYITDNAGEIVLDKLLIEQLVKKYPQLDICAAVRGGPVINDALREDANYIGLDKIVRIVDNGTHISGTQISMVGKEMKRELEKADVILAKGQGNFETMWGCGLNVYYAFLCKCDWFTKLFRVLKLSGMFANEKRIMTYPIGE